MGVYAMNDAFRRVRPIDGARSGTFRVRRDGSLPEADFHEDPDLRGQLDAERMSWVTVPHGVLRVPVKIGAAASICCSSQPMTYVNPST